MTFTINAEGIPEVPEGILFYCGAQTTADEDMLPGSFTVFAPSVPVEVAIELVIASIHDELQELDIKQAEGSLAFCAVSTWDEFAEIKIDDAVKMRALTEAMIASAYGAAISHGQHLAEVATATWIPQQPTE
jgi:hypothetical protein